MREIGERLRERARKLGLADVEVARRLGLDQTRYSKYVNGDREPDLALFVRICRELETTPNDILGFHDQEGGEAGATRAQIGAVLSGLGPEGLAWALALVQVTAQRTSRLASAADADADKPRSSSRRGRKSASRKAD